MKVETEIVAENLYEHVGDWMLGTEAVYPAIAIESPEETFGGRKFGLYAMNGHSEADLAVLDIETGTLFAGDLVFYNRAPSTPHANLELWMNALVDLASIPFKTLVPGHGPVMRDAKPIEQTASYIKWMDQTIRESAEAGDDMNEVMRKPIPDTYAGMNVLRMEFVRSVQHLWPDHIESVLPMAEDRRE